MCKNLKGHTGLWLPASPLQQKKIAAGIANRLCKERTPQEKHVANCLAFAPSNTPEQGVSCGPTRLESSVHLLHRSSPHVPAMAHGRTPRQHPKISTIGNCEASKRLTCASNLFLEMSSRSQRFGRMPLGCKQRATQDRAVLAGSLDLGLGRA